LDDNDNLPTAQQSHLFMIQGGQSNQILSWRNISSVFVENVPSMQFLIIFRQLIPFLCYPSNFFCIQPLNELSWKLFFVPFLSPLNNFMCPCTSSLFPVSITIWLSLAQKSGRFLSSISNISQLRYESVIHKFYCSNYMRTLKTSLVECSESKLGSSENQKDIIPCICMYIQRNAKKLQNTQVHSKYVCTELLS